MRLAGPGRRSPSRRGRRVEARRRCPALPRARGRSWRWRQRFGFDDGLGLWRARGGTPAGVRGQRFAFQPSSWTWAPANRPVQLWCYRCAAMVLASSTTNMSERGASPSSRSCSRTRGARALSRASCASTRTRRGPAAPTPGAISSSGASPGRAAISGGSLRPGGRDAGPCVMIYLLVSSRRPAAVPGCAGSSSRPGLHRSITRPTRRARLTGPSRARRSPPRPSPGIERSRSRRVSEPLSARAYSSVLRRPMASPLLHLLGEAAREDGGINPFWDDVPLYGSGTAPRQLAGDILVCAGCGCPLSGSSLRDRGVRVSGAGVGWMPVDAAGAEPLRRERLPFGPCAGGAAAARPPRPPPASWAAGRLERFTVRAPRLVSAIVCSRVVIAACVLNRALRRPSGSPRLRVFAPYPRRLTASARERILACFAASVSSTSRLFHLASLVFSPPLPPRSTSLHVGKLAWFVTNPSLRASPAPLSTGTWRSLAEACGDDLWEYSCAARWGNPRHPSLRARVIPLSTCRTSSEESGTGFRSSARSRPS